MRIAVVSDVHADLQAVEAMLVHARALGCSEIVCCGDVVGYGLFPDEVIDLLARHGVRCVRGNHDRWTVEGRRDLGAVELSRASMKFLRAMPESLTFEREGVRVAVHHGRPGSDMRGIDHAELDAREASELLDRAVCDVLLVGHTHVAFAVRVGARMIANPGALLRDPAPGADPPPTPGSFAVLELPALRFRVYDSRTGAEVGIPLRALG